MEIIFNCFPFTSHYSILGEGNEEKFPKPQDLYFFNYKDYIVIMQ